MSDKLRYDLIPPEILVWLAEMFTEGLKKYEENNWVNVDSSQHIASFFRHFNSWRLGSYYDEESNHHHLKHALWRIAALAWLEVNSTKTEKQTSYVYLKLSPTDVANFAKNYNQLNVFGGWEGWYRLGVALNRLTEKMSEPFNIDIMNICYSFSYAECWEDVARELGLDCKDWDEKQAEKEAREYLNKNTWLAVDDSDCIIWQNF